MRLELAAAPLALILVAAGPIRAHHSFAAEFDASKAVRVAGTLTKIEWTNPHSYFYVEAKDEQSNLVTWTCEGAAPGALSRRGFRKSDVELGDLVIVFPTSLDSTIRLRTSRRCS